jgi:hypothetical protein
MKTNHLCKRSGSSLVVVISVLATLMVIVAVAADYTATVSRHVQRSNTQQSAIALADSSIDILFSNWRKLCSTTPTIAQTSNDLTVPGKIPLPTTTQLNFPATTNFAKAGLSIDPANDEYDANYVISNYKVVGVNAQWNSLGGNTTIPEPMFGQIASAVNQIDPTINTKIKTTPLVYNYMASADVTLPALGPTGKVVARVKRVFQKQQLSPWNFAIFYVDPLEIHPGPDFTVTGWVHTNSDLYTGHDTLTFADKVTFGSDWFVGFMPGDGYHPPPPSAPHYPANLHPARDQALQPFGLDSTSLFSTTDPNANNDSYRELIEPPTSTADPMAASRYWDQADVAIRVDASNTVTIGRPETNGNLTPFTSLLANPSSGGLGWSDPLRLKYQALYDMFNGPTGPNTANAPITTGQSTSNGIIYDNRESTTATVRLVTLDLSKIQNGTGSGGLNPSFKANDIAAANHVPPYFNGIIYIHDNSASTHALNPDGTVNQNPTSPVRRGVRLKNGSKIDKMGLSIASANPVYIWGDYNTGRDYDGTPYPASNNYPTSDPTTPQVTGYNNPSSSAPGVRAPCSVLADAVTILSNSWVDSLSSTVPPATNTTVNTAIVAGIVPTAPVGGDGSYSGGAENFPRFLEAWDTHTLTYYGSMVELYKSQQATAKWQYSGVYGAPDRQWYFDNNFKTTPPPGSLMLYSYIKGKWSVQ